MGNCQSGASTGMSAPKELNPMDANPAELLNLGPDAEAFFAKGGKSYYDDVSSMNTARHLHPLCPPSIREISHHWREDATADTALSPTAIDPQITHTPPNEPNSPSRSIRRPRPPGTGAPPTPRIRNSR